MKSTALALILLASALAFPGCCSPGSGDDLDVRSEPDAGLKMGFPYTHARDRHTGAYVPRGLLGPD